MTYRDSRVERITNKEDANHLIWWYQYQRGVRRTWYLFGIPIWFITRWHDYPMHLLISDQSIEHEKRLLQTNRLHTNMVRISAVDNH